MTSKLADISYFKTGGLCKKMFAPTSLKSLLADLQECQSQFEGKFFFLGAGSNSLVSDQYWDGAVVVFTGLNSIQREGEKSIRVGAGVDNKTLVEFALAHKLSGLEWMYGLPGQVGGTVRMNARCYGGEISQVVSEVTAVSASSGIVAMRNVGEIFKGYKDTYFMDRPRTAVGEVVFHLTAGGDAERMQREMNKCLQDRQSKKQFAYPSAGCVFKNDYSVGVPSGMLIEAAGLKGYRVGRAEVSMDHANFVYNTGQASSEDILRLSLEVREKVYAEFGVWMAFEMEVLGDVSVEQLSELKLIRPFSPVKSKLEILKKKFQSKN